MQQSQYGLRTFPVVVKIKCNKHHRNNREREEERETVTEYTNILQQVKTSNCIQLAKVALPTTNLRYNIFLLVS